MNQRALEAAEEAAFGEMDDRGLFKDVGEDLFDEIKRDVTTAVITAYEAHLKAEGFVVVRAEPTDKMICAALDDYDKRGRGKQSYRDIYRAMLSAATTGENSPPKAEG